MRRWPWRSFPGRARWSRWRRACRVLRRACNPREGRRCSDTRHSRRPWSPPSTGPEPARRRSGRTAPDPRRRARCARGAMQQALQLSLLHDLVGVVLDHRVGEKLFAYPLYLLARPAFVGLGQVDLDVLALPDVVHASEAEARQRVLDRLALRVENAGLERDP